MKLLKDSMLLTKTQWRKVFTASSILIVVLYVVAMIFSLCGSNYFILNYQNTQMDNIQAFLQDHGCYSLISAVFLVTEASIIECFISKRLPKFYFPIALYVILIILALVFPQIPGFVYTCICVAYYILLPIIENIIKNKKFIFKQIGFILLRFVIATAVSVAIQAMILVIKAGYFDGVNHIMNLSAHFCYAIEYDIALSVLLFTIALYMDREKGDSKQWATFHSHSGSSQTSTTSSQKQKKQLTKTQRTKIFFIYFKLYLVQIGTFLLVMVIPFLLGKVFEFLVMYTAFCIVRFLLGFKYSLHFKKESLCALVGVVVFGILSLAVPFFYVVLILAISIGVALAILLHLSYKYKGMWLFNHVAKPDKFAELYVIFDKNLEPNYVRRMCKFRKLDDEQTNIVVDYTSCNKKSYLAKKYNYSEKTIERKLNETIDILMENI